MTDLKRIRNFSIIAHIDHGKSTLADRLIQSTGGLTEREMTSQVLDNMEIEQERGITIKAQTVRLDYKAKDGPRLRPQPDGHARPCRLRLRGQPEPRRLRGRPARRRRGPGGRGADLANVYQSIEHDHEIVPVINKIDLPAADVDKVRKEIEDIIGLPADDAVLTSPRPGSASTRCSRRSSPGSRRPRATATAPLKAMLVDSWYDPYLGVVILVRVIDGAIRKGQNVAFMAAGTTHLVDRVGAFRPKIEQLAELTTGEIGFITAQIKDITETRVGDTITDARGPPPRPCPGSSWSSRWCSAACSRSTPPISRNCARASPSCASTTPASASRWRRRRRWASASAAASSASSTSRSSRSG
jgi:GTP-binding protein LepA